MKDKGRGLVKGVILLTVLMYSVSISGKTYYVSSSSGNDSYNGTSTSSPWKTLSKVEGASSTFVAGDVIAFKGGDLFYGSLSLSNLNGTLSSPIKLTSYGTGQAIITGSKLLSGWNYESANIWSVSNSGPVYQLFKGDQPLTTARIPEIVDKFAAEENFYHITSVINSNYSFISTDLIGAPDLTGAILHVGTWEWLLKTAVISAFESSSGKVTVATDIFANFVPGNRFFINASKNLLNSEGDWYYDELTNKLYLYSTSSPSNIYGASQDKNGITLSGGSYVEVSNIKIQHYNKTGIYSSGTNNFSVSNCNILYCYEMGIRTQNGSNANLLSNSVIGSNDVGISNANDHSIIKDNLVEDIGIVDVLSKKGFITGFGISTQGDEDHVSYNKIINIGYNGLGFRGYHPILENNLVQNFHLTTTDGGGIYCYEGQRAVVQNNIVIGYPFKEERKLSQAIYIDNYSKDVTVKNNTTLNSLCGIILTHDTNNDSIIGNTVYNPSIAGIYITESNSIIPGVSDIISRDNNVFTNTLSSIPFITLLLSKTDPSRSWYQLRSNNYFNGKGFAVAKEEWSGASYDIKSWQNVTGQEENSSSNTVTFDNFSIIDVYDSTLISNGTFDTSKDGWSDWGTVSTRIEHNQNKGDYFLYDTLAATKTYGGITTTSAAVQQGFDYVLEFDMKVSKLGESLIKIAYSDGEIIYNNFGIFLNPDWTTYRIPIYDLVKNDNGLKITFYSSSNVRFPNAISLDNVKLKKCKLGDAVKQHDIVYNDTKIAKDFTFSGIWEDLDGNTYNGKINLEPFSSKILILKSTETSSINYPPDTSTTDTTQTSQVDTTNTDIIGSDQVFGLSTNSSKLRAISVTSSIAGEVGSISVYHEGGAGNLLVGVYSDNNGIPGTLIGKSVPTVVNSTAGWQTVALQTAASVTSGQTVWLAWLFENTVNVRYSVSSVNRAQGAASWSDGIPADFGTAYLANYTYSVYGNLTPAITNNNSNVTGELGSNEVFGLSTNSSKIRAIPVTSSGSGDIESISVYHEGGTGTVLVGVYSDSNGTPGTLLSKSVATSVNNTEGWQTVMLQNTAVVTSGQTVWLAWLFENTVNVRYSVSATNRAQGGASWSNGIPSDFGTAYLANFTYSVYGNLLSSTTDNNTYITGELGSNEVFGLSTNSSKIRAIPVTSTGIGDIESISVYHEGGTGALLVGVYNDNNGTPGTLISKSIPTTVNSSEGWQTVMLQNTAAITSGQTVWLAWLFENTVNVRYSVSTTNRAQGGASYTDGIPTDFGIAYMASYTYSVFANILSSETNNNSYVAGDLGNAEVFGLSTSSSKIRAIPVISTGEGDIESISVYHEGGTGNVLVGVFNDNNGIPGTLISKSLVTSVNTGEGWQTVSLQNAAPITSGQTIWLSWLFENTVNVRYSVGIVTRAQGGASWSDGIPADFGTAYMANYTYSVYANVFYYTSTKSSNFGNTETPKTIDEEVLENIETYPNPTRGDLNIRWNKDYENGIRIIVYNMSGAVIDNIMIGSGYHNYKLDMWNLDKGLYNIQLIDVDTGRSIDVKRVSKQ
ncbi:right-handed parallel beta-helix repeat-containing protein [Saccharicrinis sp. FJH62]|uniref:right-handed parallel beta-helix repeat-containing protein n=1 Tax=Saccharicrinis sp. FJH62 TaxID=3344657 RepID=UPI0035D44EDE